MKLTEKNGVSDLTWVWADGDPNGDEAAAALASGRTSFADLRRQKARDQVGLQSPDLQYQNNNMAKVVFVWWKVKQFSPKEQTESNV